MEKKTKEKNVEVKILANAPSRGRKFEGYVIRKFEQRVTIEFERVKFVKKYERYAKSKTKIHAYLPENMREKIQLGDYIQIQETRPLSKIVHHIVIKKIRNANQIEGEEK